MELAAAIIASVLVLTCAAWRRYLWASKATANEPADICPYSLRDVFDDSLFAKVPHQKGIRWLSEVFSRSVARFPDYPALHIPHTGETLSYRELDARAERVAAAVANYLTGSDQVVALAMSQDSWHIVAAHLGVLRAGGTLVVIDDTLPESLILHMLGDARPAVVLTNGPEGYRDLPTLDISKLPERAPSRGPPPWLDDPAERLATIYYTSGTTGLPKGVECAHAGYVNLALTYADYFDLVPGMDATTLTSSLGYDGSISEMYSAWVTGCAVVLLTKDQIRSGPYLIPVLKAAEVTVLFCPPVLLTTLTPAPEIDLPYPLCRYIVPAGEAFPSALVEPWTRARRQIINTYGPTEASTDTSRQSLRPGDPITIGSPFPNVSYVILDIDSLEPLLHGEPGELCIGGIHLARGYRNLPEMTARKFISHPVFGRLYRTGDRCRIDIETQQVHFLGRIDAQLKVRGHRVETQPVEDILQTQFPEIEAAVLDYQNEALVAFIAAPSLLVDHTFEVIPAPTEWAAHVTASLARQLPAPSVPTTIYVVKNFVLKPVSGKIDRQSLPRLGQLPSAQQLTGQAPGSGPASPSFGEAAGNSYRLAADTELPPGAEEVLVICRSVLGTPMNWNDDFERAGGHSIVIARLVRQLHSAGWMVSVRGLMSDCNTPRKVALLPRHQPQRSASALCTARTAASHLKRDEAAAQVLSVSTFTALQALLAILLVLPGLLVLSGAVSFLDIGTFFMTASLAEFILASIVLYFLGLLLPFATLLWVMLIKRVAFGNFYNCDISPGSYPKWSRMHLRVWSVSRMEALVLQPLGAMYRSAPLMAFALRQLGATVGRNLQCAHNAQLSGPLDLITIGDDVAIQSGAYIQPTRWSGQALQIGVIELGSGCKIGMRAAVVNNVRVGRGAWITPFTPMLHDAGPGEMWEGAPARLAGQCTHLARVEQACRLSHPIWLLETGNIFMQTAVTLALSIIPTAGLAWLARDFAPSDPLEGPLNYFETSPLAEVIPQLILYAFITTWLTIVVTSLLACLFIRFTPARPGLHSPHGLSGSLLLMRMSKLNAIQSLWTWTITGQYLRALAGLRFSRLGASECDIMFNLVPETTRAHAKVFWSNGSFTNMLDYGAHAITLRHLDMPSHFFSGNNCVAEYGQLPSNFLLGVSTPCSEIGFRRQIRTRPSQSVTVAGNPPVKFASASSKIENAEEKLPGFPLFLTRVLLNDFVSIGLLRVTETLLFAILFMSLMRTGLDVIACALSAVVLTESVLVLMTIGVKRVLIGNDWGYDHRTPFWSWRHFAYFFAQDCFFVWCRRPLAFSAGTTLSNPLLRAMGCKIGERTIITQPMQCSDWNAVDFGRDGVISGFLQFHTFENMLLKVRRTRIESECSVAFGATIMSGVTIEKNSTVAPLSLVLKEMSLPTAAYEGSPVEQVFSADGSGTSESPGRSAGHRGVQ